MIMGWWSRLWLHILGLGNEMSYRSLERESETKRQGTQENIELREAQLVQ
jgi:hypothetical protein